MEKNMKNLLSLTLALVLLTACGESSNDTANNSSDKDVASGICSKTLTKSINSTLSNVSNFEMFDSSETLCTARFQQGEKHYKVDLEIEHGTANDQSGDLEILGKPVTNYDMLEAQAGRKTREEITGVGDKAIYYALGGNYKLLALSGNDAIIVSAYEFWDKPIYKKAMTIDIAKTIISELAK